MHAETGVFSKTTTGNLPGQETLFFPNFFRLPITKNRVIAATGDTIASKPYPPMVKKRALPEHHQRGIISYGNERVFANPGDNQGIFSRGGHPGLIKLFTKISEQEKEPDLGFF